MEEKPNGSLAADKTVSPVKKTRHVSFSTDASSEDLQILIQTYRDVNAHLNEKVEETCRELDTVKSERDSWEERCVTLSKVLQRLTRERHPTFPQVDTDELERLCSSIIDSSADDNFEKSGVLLESLVQRGLSASWFIHPDEITLVRVLGQGAFGTTHLAIYRGGEVCVKCVRVESHEDRVSFFREIEALSALRHPNILPFIGASVELPGRCWLVCEYMSGGTVGKWLHGDQATRYTIARRLQVALDIAKGMEACSKCDPPIIHRDLKPSNIFMDASGNAKIGDFGLARRLDPEGTATLTGETGTYIYMSPEMIKYEIYTSATDVWSWAVVTCELMSKSLPYHGMYLSPMQVATGVKNGKLKPSTRLDIHPRLKALVDAALEYDPQERPSFEHIVEELTEIVKELKQLEQPRGLMKQLLGF